MFRKAYLDNGIPVLMQQMTGVRAVTVGIWVKVGSRKEQQGKNGISHFLEHMFFKGTKKRSPKDIAVDIDSIGGDLNAFTSKETTTFYIKVLDEYMEKGIEVLSDVFLNSILPEEEIEKEKGVIKEEIKLVEDTPDDYVHDLFSQSVWGNKGLGQPILGRRDTIKTFSRNDLLNYIKMHYGTKNIVISCAGNFKPARLLSLLNHYIKGLRTGCQPEFKSRQKFNAGINIHSRQQSEVHICLGVQSLPMASPDRYCLSILNTMLGAGISSILFQEIREKRGLVYSIHSFVSSYLDTGVWAIYVGTDKKKLNKVLGLIINELRRLPDSITSSSLQRAKQQIRGNLILGLESTGNMMQNIARQEIYYGRRYSINEIMKEIDSVTLPTARRLTAQLLRGRGIALTMLGPVDKDSLKADVSLP